MPEDRVSRAINVLFQAADDDPRRPKTDPEALWKLERHTRAWRPPTDVIETPDAYRVVVEIAGMRGVDFAVTYENQLLSIRGTRAETATQKAYHQMEIAYGEFETHVRLPSPVEVSSVEATYMDGFLRVILPKSQPRRVPIKD